MESTPLINTLLAVVIVMVLLSSIISYLVNIGLGDRIRAQFLRKFLIAIFNDAFVEILLASDKLVQYRTKHSKKYAQKTQGSEEEGQASSGVVRVTRVPNETFVEIVTEWVAGYAPNTQGTTDFEALEPTQKYSQFKEGLAHLPPFEAEQPNKLPVLVRVGNAIRKRLGKPMLVPRGLVALKDLLTSETSNATDWEGVTQAIAAWFADLEKQMSKAFKLYLPFVGTMFIVGFSVCILLNVNVVEIAREAYDADLASELGIVDNLAAEDDGGEDAMVLVPEEDPEGDSTQGSTPVQALKEDASEVSSAYEELTELGLPIGWDISLTPPTSDTSFVLAIPDGKAPGTHKVYRTLPREAVSLSAEGGATGLSIAPDSLQVATVTVQQGGQFNVSLFYENLPGDWASTGASGGEVLVLDSREPGALALQVSMRRSVGALWFWHTFKDQLWAQLTPLDTFYKLMVGWLITTLLAVFGAPFWYEVLNRLKKAGENGEAPNVQQLIKPGS